MRSNSSFISSESFGRIKMDPAGVEAVITLTPIGAPYEFERVFSLNLDTKQVDIGRASRNAAKGLTAAEDNAWFDSPIMSRQHAEFSLPSLWGNGIYLQDCGSTHGTFIGTRRLQPKVDYTINNGEVITFGVKITSGPVSYPAREFRVKVLWQPWSPSSPFLFSSPFKQGGRGFRVPDEEADSASDRSREASLQIIESHPRPYSVPSSDDDMDSDDEEEMNEASATTTPEHLAKKQQISSGHDSDSSENEICEPIDCPGQCDKLSESTCQKEEALGTSQSNPIDLEGPSKHKNKIPDIDSEDEGPEVLPISQSYLQAVGEVSAAGSFTDPKSSYRTPMDSFMLAKKFNELPPLANGLVSDNIEGKDVAGAGTSYSRLRSPKCFPQESIGDTTDDFDSIDEDDYDNDDDFLMEHYDYSEQLPSNGAFHRSSLLSFAASKPRAMFDLGQSTSNEEVVPVPIVSYCSDTKVSQEITESCLASSQRPPSPSDAALAKKADSADSRLKQSSTNDSSNAPIPPTVKHTGKEREPPQPRPLQQRLNNPVSAEPAWQNIFDDPETESSRYEDGPFASKSKINHFPLFLPHLQQQSWRPCAVPSPVQPQNHFAHRPQAFNMPAVGESKLRSGTTMPENTNDLSSRFTSICRDTKTLHRANEGQPSKVNISDLVNSYADVARNLKRKADDISTDSEIQEAISTDLEAPFSDDMDVILADAQARDVPDIEVLISQESSTSSVPDAGPSSSVTQVPDTDGPARKKMRTSVANVRGFGKFASGIFVGVAGALAAFLATIPLSVREEALREFQSAA